MTISLGRLVRDLHQSNYKINEFRDKETWDAAALQMKAKSPELYKPNFLGLFGATTGLAYPEFSTACYITAQEIMEMDDIAEFAIGIDTGLSNGEGKKIVIKKGENPDLKMLESYHDAKQYAEDLNIEKQMLLVDLIKLSLLMNISIPMTNQRTTLILTIETTCPIQN